MSGVNSFGVRWASEQFASLLKPGVMVIAVTKGMEADDEGNLRILPEVLAEQVPDEVREQVSWSAITGPAIAGEVAVRHDTCVVFTGEDTDVLDKLAATFRTDYYHVWTSPDFVGAEVCAAVKNCYASVAVSWKASWIKRANRRRSIAGTTTAPHSSGREVANYGSGWR